MEGTFFGKKEGQHYTEFDRMANKTKDMLGTYYDETWFNGAAAFQTEASWDEALRLLSDALADAKDDDELRTIRIHDWMRLYSLENQLDHPN